MIATQGRSLKVLDLNIAGSTKVFYIFCETIGRIVPSIELVSLDSLVMMMVMMVLDVGVKPRCVLFRSLGSAAMDVLLHPLRRNFKGTLGALLTFRRESVVILRTIEVLLELN
jgi:hypothetical protein